MSRRTAAQPIVLSLLLGSLALSGCRSTPDPDPRYRPSENLLELVAVLRRHVPDDTYHFPPARDFTGRNIYRASLLRLENLQKVHAEAFRSGYMDDVIAFARGRALERLRAFDLAAASYQVAAEIEGALQQEARESQAICEALSEAAAIGPEQAPIPEEGDPIPLAAERESVVALFDRRVALLEALLVDAEGTHYAFIIREEIERADMGRARFLRDTRRLYIDGDVRALAALQQLVASHRESKNANRHLLALADLYAELAVDYVESHPPQGLRFDPPRFEELVEAAARLYEAITNQDGAPEKLEAARRLEAFLAFTLKVDRDRFSP
jgi:hypothetical protein